MADDKQLKKVVIRAWPKMIFLWPSTVVALAMCLAQNFLPAYQDVWGGVFLLVLALNLTVLTFEFPRATSLTVLFAGVAVVLLLMLLNHQLEIVAPLAEFIKTRKVTASTEFYLIFFLLNTVLLIAMYGVTRFDYWELTSNELVHHHGLLGDIERFSTAGLKLNKEIADVFEYALCGAGRVIMLVPGSPRPIVLDNVLNISKVEKLSDRILNARVVRVEREHADETPHTDVGVSLHEAEGG